MPAGENGKITTPTKRKNVFFFSFVIPPDIDLNETHNQVTLFAGVVSSLLLSPNF